MLCLLVAGDLDAGGWVGEPQGGERHARHRVVEITATGGEAVDDLEIRYQWGRPASGEWWSIGSRLMNHKPGE